MLDCNVRLQSAMSLLLHVLHVGGRAPSYCVSNIMALDSCTLEWRVRRLGLFLRLVNAPVGSWSHLALIAHHHLNTDWFRDANADLKLIIPGHFFIPSMIDSQPHLSCSGRWSDDGEWNSGLAFCAYVLWSQVLPARQSPCCKGATTYQWLNA